MADPTREPILVVIPARGGSKGVPRKNLAEIGGIPLVGRSAWIARRALNRLCCEGRVVCSTDDEEIARVAKEWGAEIPFMRPAELATDEAGSIDVILHAIRACRIERCTVVVLQPTSPLVDADDVVRAVRLHAESDAPVVSVAEIDHPAQWIFRLDDQSRMTPVLGEEIPGRRQEVTSQVSLNGAVYIASSNWLREGKPFLTPETRASVMPRARSVDVDEPGDLKTAEGLLASAEPRGLSIGSRELGPGRSCLVIAEIGVNHDGDLSTALELVEASARAGADAVKVQTFAAERLVTRNAPKAEYQLRTTDPGESQFEMLKRLELTADDVRRIQERCRDLGLLFLSTPFDELSADFLEDLDVPAFKVGSGDLTNLPFLEHMARKGRPMIVSTGMATIREVAEAVEAVTAAGLNDLVLLQCVSDYPADPATVNLNAMVTMQRAFGFPVGFSDHTEGMEAATAAVAKGAAVVEKHLTLDRTRPGPDHRASIEPPDLERLVQGIRTVEACLGSGEKKPAGSERGTAKVARKSIVALRDITCGEVLDESNVGVRRPEGGMRPGELPLVFGRRAGRDIAEGEWLQPNMID